MRRLIFFLLFTIIVAGCKKKKDVLPPPKSSVRNIHSFIFYQADNPALSGNIVASIAHDSIIMNMSAGTNVTNLVPAILYTGAGLSPNDKQPENFTNSVQYTVTADDGSQSTYKIFIRFLANAKDITSFIFKQSDNPALPHDLTGIVTGDSILFSIAPGIDVSSLKPTIIYTGVSMTPESGITENFVYPVGYGVQAEDGTVKTYNVFVSGNNDLFIHSDDGYLYDINSLDGTVRWKYNIGGNGAPTYNNGVVFATGGNNIVYAINALDGSLKWTTTPLAGNYTLTMPSVKYGKVYFAGTGWINDPSGSFAYYEAFVYAIDEGTGNQGWFNTWFKNIAIIQSLPTNVTVEDNIVCAYDIYNGLFVFNATDGSFLYAPGAELGRANPAIANNTIYYGIEGGIRAINESTGQEIWHYINSQNYSSPTVSNGIAYTGTAKNILGFNSGGSITWQVSVGYDATFYAPVVLDNNLFISNSKGELSSYSLTNGSLNWTKQNCGPYPLVANGYIYVCDGNHRINCIEASSGNLRWLSSNSVFSQPACVVDYLGNVHHTGESGEEN